MTHLRSIELKPKDIKEFQRIYRMEYGEEISYEEAETEASKLLSFLAFVL